MNEPSIIDRSVEKAHVWINEVAEQLGSDDHRLAYRVLRAYLHALRDRLPVNEAAQLAAQLPELIRGIYYEGWKPATTPVHYRDLADFLDWVAAAAQPRWRDVGLLRRQCRGGGAAPPRQCGRGRERSRDPARRAAADPGLTAGCGRAWT